MQQSDTHTISCAQVNQYLVNIPIADRFVLRSRGLELCTRSFPPTDADRAIPFWYKLCGDLQMLVHSQRQLINMHLHHCETCREKFAREYKAVLQGGTRKAI